MIVVFSIIDMSLQDSNFGYIKIIRLLRVLMPLRFISRNPNLRLLVNALIDSIGGIVNVSLVIIIIWTMFAILFINLLSNNSGFCDKLAEDKEFYRINKV